MKIRHNEIGWADRRNFEIALVIFNITVMQITQILKLKFIT